MRKTTFAESATWCWNGWQNWARDATSKNSLNSVMPPRGKSSPGIDAKLAHGPLISHARYRDCAARLERHTCSPGWVEALCRRAATIDVSPMLAGLRVPMLLTTVRMIVCYRLRIAVTSPST